MRAPSIALLLATATSVLHADVGITADFPKLEEKEWRQVGTRTEVADVDGLELLHREAFESLSDLSQASDKGIALYARIAELLAGSRDLDNARAAYLGVVREMAFLSVGRGVELVPDSMLDAATGLARTDAEKSLVHFLSAWRCADSPSAERRSRAGLEFALATSLDSPLLYEQMLLCNLRWAMTDGASEITANGGLKTCPDYERALQLCEEIASTSHRQSVIDYAVNCANNIMKPTLALDVVNSFRTGSQAQFGVDWRNCENVDIALYPIRIEQMLISGDATDPASIARTLPTTDRAEPVRRLTLGTQPTRKYYPVDDTARMDDLLLPGTYLIKATAGDQHAEDLLCITDSILIFKIGKEKVLAYACNAQTGKPIPGGTISLWTRAEAGVWRRTQKSAGPDGIAVFSGAEIGSPEDATTQRYVALLTKDQQQAIAIYSADNRRDAAATTTWSGRIFTDSDDYAPSDTLHILTLVRQNSSGQYTIPKNETLRLELTGPETFVPLSATATVDETGTATAQIQIPGNAPHGTYKLSAFLASDGRPIGKIRTLAVHGDYTPDYRILIRFDDASRTYLPSGGTLKGFAKVTTPTGDAVSGQPADVEIDERPYNVTKGRGRGEWTLLSRTTSHTNAAGEVAFSCKTGSEGQDREIRVRVVVADSDETPSVATARILATRQSFYARLKTEEALYEQGHSVKLSLTTQTASREAVPCKGSLKLLRESWHEVWTDRRGHEISGDEMRENRRRGNGWFGLGQNNGDYVLKSQGYRTETILETPLVTDDRGQAYFVWDDAKPGYYRFAWIGQNADAALVSSEQTFWVSGKNSGIEGYRPDHIRLVTDTSGNGSELTMITAPATNQSVLVLRGADDITSGTLVELKGTAQALETKRKTEAPTEYLEAICVNDEKIDSATTLLRSPIPPRLNVTIRSNRTDYEPGQNAGFDVLITDSEGQPVPGARVCFWVTGTSDQSDIGEGNIFPTVPSGYRLETAASCQLRPFFQPLQSANGAAASASAKNPAHGSDSEQKKTDETDFWNVPTAPTAVWIEDAVSAPDGTVHFDIRMPRLSALWRVEAVASLNSGAAGVSRSHVMTDEPLSIALNAPESLYAGDLANITTRIGNNQPDNISFALTMNCVGLASSLPEFFPSYGSLAPDSPYLASWPVSFINEGRAQIHASVSTRAKNLSYLTETLVRTNLSHQTLSTSFFSSGAELTPPMIQDGWRPLSYECTITASPSHIALEAISSLLSDRSGGTTEACARLSAVSSLQKLLRSLRYGGDETRDALFRCGVTDYENSGRKRDIDTLLSGQSDEGPWGWLSATKPDSDATARNLVLFNLSGVNGDELLLKSQARARTYAATELAAETLPPDVRAMLLFGLANRDQNRTKPSRLEARSLVGLMRLSDSLSPYALACLALSAKQYGFDDEASEIVTQLLAKATKSGAGSSQILYWNASTVDGNLTLSEVENTALSVLALIATGHTQDEATAQAFRFLYKKNENGHWDGPSETALCILALREFSISSGETDLDARYALVLNGRNVGQYDSATDNRLGFPVRFPLKPMDDKTGIDSFRVSRISGNSPVFVSLLTTCDTGDATSPTANRNFALTRRYYRTMQVPTLLDGAEERVVEMNEEEPLAVGDRLDAVITLATNRATPALVIEEPKPAFASWQTSAPELICTNDPALKPGLVQVANLNGSLVMNVEDLPAGIWEIRTPMRVDYSGHYVLPPIRAWVPGRPSIAADSGVSRVVCGAKDENATD